MRKDDIIESKALDSKSDIYYDIINKEKLKLKDKKKLIEGIKQILEARQKGIG